MRVITIGPFQIEGELAMDFVPTTEKECDLCAARGPTANGVLRSGLPH